MRVLVAVASKHGSTREIASAIADEMRNSGIEVDQQDIGEVSDIKGYDAVVIGSAVYVGKWLPEAQSFAERHASELSNLPVWIFSSGPLGVADPQPHDDLNTLAAPMSDVPVRDHRVFVGKLDPAQLGFGERLMAKMVRAPYGDFRDWDDIRAWARQVATELHQPPATA